MLVCAPKNLRARENEISVCECAEAPIHSLRCRITCVCVCLCELRRRPHFYQRHHVWSVHKKHDAISFSNDADDDNVDENSTSTRCRRCRMRRGTPAEKKNQYYKPIKFSDVLYFEIYSYYIIVAGRCCHFILYGSTARTHTHPPEPANVVFSFTQLAFCVVFLTASSRWYLRLSGWRCVSIATEGIGSRYLFSSCVHRIFLADAW